MELFPQESTHIPKAKSGNAREDADRDDDTNEEPETAHERAALQLGREQPPCKRCRADEARQEPDVRRKILDRRAAKLIELGENGRPSSQEC